MDKSKMNETIFFNRILSNNQDLVEYYTTNPRDVIRLCNIDIETLKGLAIEFYKADNNEEIRTALVTTILAIKKMEKENEVKTNFTK